MTMHPQAADRNDTVCLRPIEDADMPFLRLLYAGTRASEMAMLPWDDEQRRAFLYMQFDAQHDYYTKHYRQASFDLIVQGKMPIGRLYVEEWPREIRVIDIALLPEHCNRGVGSRMLDEIMERAASLGKGVSIHVEQDNPAMRLYLRLGFVKVGEHGVYDLMRWNPPD